MSPKFGDVYEYAGWTIMIVGSGVDLGGKPASPFLTLKTPPQNLGIAVGTIHDTDNGWLKRARRIDRAKEDYA